MATIEEQVAQAELDIIEKNALIEQLIVHRDKVQAEQNLYISTLNAMANSDTPNLMGILNTKGDWIFTFYNPDDTTDFYLDTGGVGTLNSNMTNWLVFNTIRSDVVAESSDTFRVVAEGDYTSEFSLGQQYYIRKNSPTLPIPYGTVSDIYYDEPLPIPDPENPPIQPPQYTHITMSMTEGDVSSLHSLVDFVYEFEGLGWDNNADILSIQAKTEVLIDSMHHPMDITGTYGTIANIATIQSGINMQYANIAKLEDFISKFG